MKTEFVIYKSRKKAIIVTITGLLTAVAGWIFLRYSEENVVGWSFVILSILCFLFGFGSLFDRKPYIILTENGITEMSIIREEIEWNAILRADEFYYRGQYFIRLLMDRNYKAGIIQPIWFNRLDRIYEKEGVKAIFIRINFLEVNSIKLTGFIDKMIKANSEKKIELLNKQPENW